MQNNKINKTNKDNKALLSNILKTLVYISAAITVFTVVAIVGYILFKGIMHINISFLNDILPIIVSTLLVILIGLIIALPIGIFSAIYLNEYSKNGKTLRLVRFCIETLAGIPSIIYGLFGMLLFVTFFHLGFSILSGALTLSIMVLPVMIRTTEESLKTVPMNLREGSLALGATKIRTIFVVVLPQALPGILTGILLSIGRMIGESAAIYLTAGMVAKMPESIMSSGRTLSVHMYLLAKEGYSIDQTFATASTLIILILVINYITNKVVSLLR